MKGTTLLVVVLLFVFFPWIIGVIDILSWALFGVQATNIPWSDKRGFVLFLWPLVVGFVVAFIVDMSRVDV